MHHENTPAPERTGLQEVLEPRLQQRTWGRLRDLRVQILGNRVIVQGQTDSYYVKQLAIQTLLDALEGSEWIPDVEIDVVSTDAFAR
jgi:hypothetical protein